jgi:hypothetical protein
LSLREKGLPTSTLEEFGSYAWPTSKPDRNDKEVPVDAYNHGMDALRYMVMRFDAGLGMSQEELDALVQWT